MGSSQSKYCGSGEEMRILIDVNHPAHVHLFRCAAKDWIANGDAVLFTATDKDVALRLLDAYKLPHEVIYQRRAGAFNLARELALRTIKLMRVGRRFKPDVFLSMGSPTAAWAAALLRKPHIAFEDTEDSIGQIWLYRPFSTAICVPECFQRDLGRRMVRYEGCHELAYLHPKRFTPDPAKIEPLLSNQRYFVVRFISWDAAHDKGEGGLSSAGKDRLLEMLARHGRIVLSVEKNPPLLLAQGAQPEVTFAPDALHHLLAFAYLYVGEGVTAASEAAVLGTPSVLINTRAMGYIVEQQERYCLSYLFGDENEALSKIERMLAQPDLKNVWQCRRDLMLRDKVDVTAWMEDFVRGVVSGQRKNLERLTAGG